MSEFARSMTLAEARRQTVALTLVADAEERAAIATRFALLAVDRLEAELTLAVDGEDVRTEGRMLAEVVQACVATGEPVAARIDAPVAVRFTPLATLEAAQEDSEIELASDDLDIIGYAGGRFDLGDMIAETLALELDPYPRSPGADAVLKERGVLSEGEAGQFGALAALRDRLGGQD